MLRHRRSAEPITWPRNVFEPCDIWVWTNLETGQPTLRAQTVMKDTVPDLVAPGSEKSSNDSKPECTLSLVVDRRSNSMELSRRSFLEIAGIGTLGFYSVSEAFGATSRALSSLLIATPADLVTPDFVKKVIRPSDLLAVTFEFYNFAPVRNA